MRHGTSKRWNEGWSIEGLVAAVNLELRHALSIDLTADQLVPPERTRELAIARCRLLNAELRAAIERRKYRVEWAAWMDEMRRRVVM